MRDMCHHKRNPKAWTIRFAKITRWRNKRKTKINYRSCHHIALVTSFPTSQEFCNSDSVWDSYANFSEDAQKISPPQSFALFSKSCENTERINDEQMKCLIYFWSVRMCLNTHSSGHISCFPNCLQRKEFVLIWI